MAAKCQHCGQACADGTTLCGACARALRAGEGRPPQPFPVFVGRQKELYAILDRLDDAREGRGSLAMITGEAGVGKTWLARQVAGLAASRDATVLWGCCFEGDWQPAYGPWVEAIGDYVQSRSQEELRGLLGTGASTLAKLIPLIGSAVPDLADAPPLGPDDERIRLYDAVIRLLHSLAEGRPVLLVLDDLHWADRDSLRLLRYLARSIPRMKVLVLGVYRELEDGDLHPLTEMLSILRREADYQPITLRGLTRDDVATYLEQTTGKPMPGAVVDAVFGESSGNPFYVRELLRHLTEEGKLLLRGGRWSTDFSIGELGIPEGVRQLVHARLSRLTEQTNAVLRLAAGFSGGFEFPVLQALSSLPEDYLLDCIDEALRSGVLRVTGDSPAIYDFAHAIVRHTLYEELNPDRRARLHRRIAQALEQVFEDRAAERAGELAYQYRASADLPNASNGLRYALIAAERARAACAYERAATFLITARDLAKAGPAGATAEILCRLAVAQAEALMLEESSLSVREALSALSDLGANGEMVATFLEEVARALKDGGAPSSVWNPLVEQGISALDGGSDLTWARLTLLHARLEPVCIGTLNVGRWLGHAPRAVEIARRSGSEDDYARTLEPLDWRSREETERILALARGWTNPVAKIRALDVVGRDLLKRHGDHREAAKVYQELLETSERYGYIPGQAESLMQLAITQAALGELTVAQQTARRANEMIQRLGPGHELRFGATALVSILTFILDRNWPESTLAAAKFASSPEAGRNPRGLVAGAYAALGYARMGDHANSKRLLAILTPVIDQMEPRMYVHHSAVAFGGSAVWEMGAAEFAASYRRLALGLIESGYGDTLLAHELTVARMDTLLGNFEEAGRYFKQARETTDAMGLKPIRAMVDFDEALALKRRGLPVRAAALLPAALRSFEILGMPGWAERACALMEELAADQVAPTEAEDQYPAGLTGREAEVLTLIADGKTNGEIAEELVLSIRTVERHVANIYVKIGAHSRVGATNFALRAGIAAPRGAS